MAATPLSYYPPEDQLAARIKAFESGASLTSERLGSKENVRLPRSLDSPLAWTRQDIEKDMHQCILKLSEADITSLEKAAKAFEDQAIPLSDISTENFVLPQELKERLRKVSNQCYYGRGFTVVQGLEPDKYSPEWNVILYAGIAAHVAPQHGLLDKSRRKVLCHVVNAASKASPTEAAQKSPGFTNGPLAFHTDNCEILALYALDVATTGGQTFVSSSYQLFNELAQSRPEVLQTLSDYWVLDTFKDYSQFPPVTRPMLHVSDTGDVMFTYSRFPMAGFKGKQRNSSLAPVSEAQIAAMDAVQFVMAKNAVPLPWKKGDIAFINDMAIMHARSSFTESGQGLQRHLLKFYLRDPAQNWKIPESAQKQWDKIYGPNTPDGGRDEEWCIKYEAGQENDWESNG
ncbi:Clavaminate synthase-like protein [Annulohypoxylon truncatum]|uniref:Clavaminate synthase-like protein n=1 Tax=Annulohypoxylon truncatum TaxID=327061 RepID=UPI0020079318|nr:Clavaminate synthase-like protein [Annulohypoxylon truncatum]KAI1214382.1 Clavaminate synthase-like protein [Annulohypoxylon truncatum]